MFNWSLSRKLDHLGARANPDAAFVKALETRLLAKPARFALHRSRAMLMSLTTIGVLFAGTGVYAYSSDSVLPDHPLYPLRQTIESVEAKLAPTTELKAAVQVKHLKRRLKESLLLNAQDEHVSPAHAESFANELRRAIESSALLPDDKRQKMDETVANVEGAYTSVLVQERDKAKDEQEKQVLDKMIERQTEKEEKKDRGDKIKRRERLDLKDTRQKRPSQRSTFDLEDEKERTD